MKDGRADDRDAGSDVPRGFEDLAHDTETAVHLAGHFYRGEIDRVTTWRTRLDQTTNWAVVVMAAILTWAFSSVENPHYVLLIGALAVGVFLLVEAQRYQEYDAWRSRVRLLQRDLFAGVFSPDGPEDTRWYERLSDDLREPSLGISMVTALGHRLRRVYFPLLTVLLAAWGLRITVFETGESWRRSAAIADVSGAAVVAAVGTAYLLLSVLTFWSMHRAGKREFDRDVATSLSEGTGEEDG